MHCSTGATFTLAYECSTRLAYTDTPLGQYCFSAESTPRRGARKKTVLVRDLTTAGSACWPPTHLHLFSIQIYLLSTAYLQRSGLFWTSIQAPILQAQREKCPTPNTYGEPNSSPLPLPFQLPFVLIPFHSLPLEVGRRSGGAL